MLFDEYKSQLPDIDPEETEEWLESLDEIIQSVGPTRARYILRELFQEANKRNVGLPNLIQTPYINTIPPEEEPAFPGDEMMEKRIRRIIRWNAMAMVQRGNKRFPGLGGHLSTYASSASLYEVGFNHFFRGREASGGGDQIFFQGHAAPGVYARAFLEGRITEAQLEHFRRECSGEGLSSYPHPWLMKDFWQFPTVSMGLGPISAIYQARFNRYLHNRGLKDTTDNRVWAFLGDGESDEPEALGALSVAAREGLDNLIFVVNCNLQRLDGPVRGNGKIIQELEAVFRGAGWHVIKVIWGPEWDPLLAKDVDGLLVDRMNTCVDGQFQKYCVEDGAYIRNDFFGTDQRLLDLVQGIPDEALPKLRRGGHSYRKLYAAYRAATDHQDAPVAILCKTVKGWTLGESFEASNVTHQMKKMDDEHLKKFRDTLELPIPDSRLEEAPYYHPGENSPEVEYLKERRSALGGYLPSRQPTKPQISCPPTSVFEEFYEGGKAGLEFSTTMAFVRLLRKLLKDKGMGKHIVPIIPDEARTFGMDPLFREIGIYAALGQKYEPVDAKHFLNYHEAVDGQLLEEGITEAGSMATFQAAGTAHAQHGIHMIPFYTFYSMFGLQRTGDQAWQFGDARGRGFLMGATAGRTTLNGEGLQHQDGNSQLVANTIPNVVAYDPAYAYELAVIIEDGLQRMLDKDEDVFYYITIYNENYVMPSMPKGKGVKEGILNGMYKLKAGAKGKKHHAQILGSGTLMSSALEAQKILASKYDVSADIWSVTSYQQLYRNARSVERENRLNPVAKPKASTLEDNLGKTKGPIVSTCDWVQELPAMLGRFMPRRFVPLGASGFGRSDTREALRKHFEVDSANVVIATLHALMLDGEIKADVVADAMQSLGVEADKIDPMQA
ncbi:MAG: pyruvate dehydrogenase (acetyl-transferring), homodimeric type [Myxococcales bacterium]|nr:pyruvate dehydrogenase (acetyl-transferring), homodimeric type [Myxococcales bacterium]